MKNGLVENGRNYGPSGAGREETVIVARESGPDCLNPDYPFSSCRGCGRRIPLRADQPGTGYLCSVCHHRQVLRGEKGGDLTHRAFTTLVLSGIAAVGLAGISLCILYLLGTGRTDWFALLLVGMFLVVFCPAMVLRRRRHLALLAASLYFPLGLWCFTWSLAPGVGWEYPGSMAWGALFFLLLGSLGVYLYRRDLKALSRW